MNKKSILLIALLTATALSPYTPAEAACPANVANGQTSNATCHLDNGTAVTVQQGGTINGANIGVLVDNNVAVGSIYNYGTIRGNGAQGVYLVDDSSRINLILNGVGALITGTNGIDIDSGFVTNGIESNGTITATSGSGIRIFKADISGILLGETSVVNATTRGVELVRGGSANESASITGSIVNNGKINSGSTGILNSSGLLSGSIINSATGEITSTTGHGIQIVNTVTNYRPSVLDINNAGAITASGASGDGINLQSADAGGDIYNTGTINAGAYGIRIGNASVVSGDLNNLNTINSGSAAVYVGENSSVRSVTNGAAATLTSTASQGIFVKDSAVFSGITNDGTINTNSTGIYVQETGNPGNATANAVTNTGSITSTMHSGIHIEGGNIATNLINEATGSLTANGNLAFNSSGILLSHGARVRGNVENRGTINANDGIVIGDSVNAGATVDNHVINSGDITARSNGMFLGDGSQMINVINTAQGVIDAGTIGMHFDNASVTGQVENAGEIESQGDAIYVANTSQINGSITNSGTISSGGAGIVVSRSAIIGDVTNTAAGKITAAGHGIRFTNGGDPTRPRVAYVTNAGSIITTAGGIGISLDTTDVNGAVLNSGTINADGDGISIVDATIVSGKLTNSNTITSAAGHGININGTTVRIGDITNEAGASITAANGSALLINGSDTGTIANDGTLSGDYAINITDNAHSRILNNTGILNGSIKIDRTTLNLNNGSVASGKIGGTNGVVNIDTNISTSEEYGVDDGTLAAVNLASGRAFTVLGGANKIFDTNAFSNNGTLRIVGNPSTSAVMTVTGDYTQGANALLSIDAQFPTIRSAINVAGTANFDPNARIHLNITGNEFDFAGGAVVQNVVSAGTLNATTFDVTDSSYLYNFNAVIQGQTVSLHSLRDTTNSVSGAVASGGNKTAQGASQALEEIISGTPGQDMQTVINALGSLSSAKEVADAVSQTLPTLTGGSTTAMLQTMSTTGKVIQARNSQNTGLSSGDGIIGDNNAWAKPFGTWSNQKQDDGVVGYDADTYGIIAGYDNSVSDDMRLGVALSYARTDVESDDSRNKMDIDSYQASLYGSYAMGPKTEANFQLGGGYNNADSKRTINFGGIDRVADGDISGYAVQAGAGVGHSIDIGRGATFTPSARVDYALIHNQSYTETGAGGLNLNVKSQTTDQLIPSVSGKLGYEYAKGLSLDLNAGVGYDVLNERNSVTASYVGGGSAFLTEGMEPSPWVVRSGAGLTYNATEDLDITIRYDREDRGKFDTQTASARFRTQF